MTAFFSKHKRSKSILVLLVTFLLSFSLCFMTACDDEDDTTTPPTTVTDNCTIANGNFEYYSDDDNLKLIVAASNWTNAVGQDSRGNSASESTVASGIVNTDETLWNSFTTSSGTTVEIAEDADLNQAMDEAETKWESMNIYDRLHFYKDLEDAIEESDDDDLSLRDFELYEDYDYSVDAEDIPDCENPGTHEGSAEGENSVLMIHNYRTDGYGTAQKYTSSTNVSLNSHTSAKLSVWVNTQNLTYANGQEVDGTRGANISLTHKVGNTTLEQMQINNIDTKGEWVQYTIYVKACSYASSSFTVVLGLGHGSSTDSFEYVEGYAFFDDVEVETISNEDYDQAVKSGDEYTVPYCTMHSDADEKKFATDTEAYKDEYVYALDLYHDLEDFSITADTEVSFDLTSTIVNNTAYTSTNYKNLNISTANDITTLSSWNQLNGQTSSNEYLSTIWEADFAENYPFDKDGDLIMLMSAQGAAYTAKMNATGDLFTLGADEYMLVSFWVKTSNVSGTGASIALYDASTPSVLGPYNTTTFTTVDIEEQEDLYDGWAQCFYFVKNTTDSEKDFRLEFSYGPRTITGTNKSSYYEGYAAFTEFTYSIVSETEFNNFAGSANRSSTVSLVGANAQTEGKGFDEVGTIDKEKIEQTLADPMNYSGVTGGSIWTGGDAECVINSNENAGLLHKDYVANYSENNAAWLTNLLDASNLNVTESLSTLSWWKEIFGTSTQPLLISNVVEQSYGYLSARYNLSANGYSAVAVRVKVSAGAKAYVYLIDTSDLWKGYDETQTMKTVNVTYWYDDEGNVCLADPAGDDFNIKSDTAFYVLDSGLFQNALNASDTNLYANLANYEKDEDGNLIAETNSSGKPLISYDYSDNYKDDGVAFYYNEGKYYADKEYTVEVKDFSAATVNGKSFTAEYARYVNVNYLDELGVTADELGADVTLTDTADTDTCIVVDGNNPAVANKWVTVSFYLSMGNDAFPYRLEVFSGARDGSDPNPAGSFVAFDVCTPADLNANYEGLLSEAIEEMTDKNGYTDSRLNETVYLEEDAETGRLVYASGDKAGQIYENAQYYTYSFYDDTAFRRYDSALDENENGNPYESYVQSDYSEDLTFLYYETSITPDEMNYCMFMNYSPIDQYVTPDDGLTIDDEDDEEENWWEDPNFWLMFSSIILAIVLILVLLIMLIARIVRTFKKKSKTQSHYNAKRMHYIRKLNLSTEEESEDETEAETTSESDETNPYND